MDIFPNVGQSNIFAMFLIDFIVRLAVNKPVNPVSIMQFNPNSKTFWLHEFEKGSLSVHISVVAYLRMI